MEKLCVFCKHLTMFDGSHSMDSSYDESGVVFCERDYWEISPGGFTEEFREKILQAETCPDYEQA